MLDIPFLSQLEYLLRIFVAMICGGMIGFERERRVKSAGLKTHIIVSMGAALMMIVSKYGFWDVLVQDTIKLDPSRMAASIVSAIGFIGAGIIFTRGFKINGVTTAAGLWTTVGVGMALGAGLYFIGIISTLLILLVQLIFRHVHLNLQTSVIHVRIVASGTKQALDNVRDLLKEMNCSVLKTKFTDLPNKPGELRMDLYVTVANRNCEERLMWLFDYHDADLISLEIEP